MKDVKKKISIYSQNEEEYIIKDYFGDTLGCFLDIGAYDGIKYSNTRAFALEGWKGCLVEPNKAYCEQLTRNYAGFGGIYIYDFAIGIRNGVTKFYENDTFYSTISVDEKSKWEGQFKFETKECDVVTFKSFLQQSHYSWFDFITIDAEGMDYEILSQMNLNSLGCSVLCIEWNGKDRNMFYDYVAKFGFELIYTNSENLIFARPYK